MMSGLIPFNRRNTGLRRTSFDDFNNMLDDFFNDNWMNNRDLLKDTFKIDIKETDQAYVVEAEMPGIKKDEIDLNINGEDLCISVNREEETNQKTDQYLHRERRTTSMSRRVRLVNSKLDEIKAKLKDGVLVIDVPKDSSINHTRKIEIE